MRIFFISISLLTTLLFALGAEANNHAINTHDIKLQSIIKKALGEKLDNALAEAASHQDPKYALASVTAVKLYQSPKSFSAHEMIDLFKKNAWLPIDLFANRFEASLTPGYPTEDMVGWFTFRPPTTALGKFYFLHANIERKTLSLNDAENRNMLRYYWKITEFDLATEEYFLKKYKNYLTIDDCLSKIEFLTWKGKFAYAEKLLGILPKKYTSMAYLRINVAQKPESLFKFISGRSAEERSDEYIQYVYIGRLLENEQEAEALRRLRQIKSTDFPEKWWRLRNMAVRNEFREKHYLSAYNLASKHGLKSGAEFAEAEWLAGWLALRFLKEYDKALIHFRALYDHAKLAGTQAKAAYWVARTYEVLENQSRVHEWYATAAGYAGTFYGHISLGKIHGQRQIDYFSDNLKYAPSRNSDIEKAWKLAGLAFYLYKNGATKLAKKLIETLPQIELSTDEVQTLAKIFLDNGLYGLSVDLSKTMANKSGILLRAGYPSHIQIFNNHLPKGLYLGIIRQESNFNQNAVSSAGAAGLMQLMPATAAELAKGMGLRNANHITDPSVNVLKGVTYINKLFEQYQHIVPTLAAYNAGPGSVNKWLSRYGDPREFSSEYQTIDWIESIPFVQTRDYVKKVLENFVIYDSMLSKRHTANTLIAYLESK